jgi:N6-L-threonylcarbamoyladenine synthase
MRILGIETSCDETAAAVVEDGRLLSNAVYSQTVHRRFGGVVPEMASRGHLRAIVPMIRRSLEEAGVSLDEIDAVAPTMGPGLIGSLIVGVATAGSICLALDKPLVGVDHTESHVAAVFLSAPRISDPFLCLVVSGGHTHLFRVEGPLDLRLVAATRDDAAGEAFDKVARMLGLDYPGGPEVEREAGRGDPRAVEFPRPVMEEPGFSFSGLKTAVRYFLERQRGEISSGLRADVAAGFQEAVGDVLVEKTVAAAAREGLGTVAMVGGVASNSYLRERLRRRAEDAGLEVILPRAELCTDNGAIVAASGYYRFQAGLVSGPTLSPYSTRTYPV